MNIKTIKSITAAALLSAASGSLSAADITFTSWGGTTQDAQKEAWAAPYQKQTGGKVIQDGPTDYGKIKAMVESGNVAWDVVDVEYDYAVKAAKDGLLEKLDFSIIDRSKLDPRFVTDYAVGSFYYAFVLGSSKSTFGKNSPETWQDLFDVKKYPGKRTFYKWSAPGVLEIALLADGVKPEALYPLDLDRAFAKLDTIKDDIIWWTSGAQSQQLLASAEAPLGMFWNGRLSALEKTGVDVNISWDQNVTAADMLVVPKGSKNKEAAMKFLAIASSAQAQADFSRLSAYAPINIDSEKLLDKDIAKTLPNKFTGTQVDLDMNYWAENRDEIGKRWYAWQAK